MRPDLQSVLASLRGMERDELPELLGELEVVRANVLLKLSTPTAPLPCDGSLTVKEAAGRLGVGVDYVYDHQHDIYRSLCRREGRKLLFSSQAIDRYIQKTRAR